MKILKNMFKHILSPKEYKQGLKLYKMKQWKAAADLFALGVKSNPTHAHSRFKLGVCLLKLGDAESAQPYIESAIGLAPYNKQWLVQLEQANKKLDYIYTNVSGNNQNLANGNINPTYLPRVSLHCSTVFTEKTKKKLLILPSAFNHRVMSDITPYKDFYKEQFDVYVIIKELDENIIKENGITFLKNKTAYGEYIKFTADFVIDAGCLNFGHRLTNKNKWVSVWHGIPYKKMFIDTGIHHLPTALRYASAYDLMVSMSDFYTEVFLRNAMRYEGDVLQLGCAKVDSLINTPQKIDAEALRKIYSISSEQKVVLYAPAERDSIDGIKNFPFDSILNLLGDAYTFVVMLSQPLKGFEFSEATSSKIKFVSNLTEGKALLLADILISDYRLCISDFGKYKKSVVLYQYDYSHYIKSNEKTVELLESISSSNQFIATRVNHLLSLDWNAIKQSSENAALPDNWSCLRYDLGIPQGKKVILYAPTFRQEGEFKLPFNSERLLSVFGEEWVLVTKLHYLNHLDNESESVIDCSTYSEIADLMMISDVLISDYSSLILDYALLNKPIVLFQYDYYDYMKERGVYFDFENYLPKSQIIYREIDLYQIVQTNLLGNNCKLIEKFYPIEDGNSLARITKAFDFDATPRLTKEIIFLVNDLNQIGGVYSFIKNMAKFYKENYNSKIYVLAIKEFAGSNSDYHVFDSPYIDYQLSSELLNGGCATILQNTDGLVISLQFSAHLHFQKHLKDANSVLMFHGDVKDILSGELYGPHLGWLNEGVLFNYKRLLLLTKSNVELLANHVVDNVRNKLDFIPNSIGEEFSYEPSTNINAFAYVSRLDNDKNIFAIIDLAKKIVEEGKNFIINVYGDGPLKNEFVKQIDDNNLSEIIRMRGYVTDKSEIFQHNAALLLLSKSEGLPLVILEAYAFGRPVIVFDTFTGAKDIVKNGITGYLVEDDNFAAVIKSIDSIDKINIKDIENFFNEFSNQAIFSKWNELSQDIFNNADVLSLN